MALNKLITTINIPAISSDLFKRYEREIGPEIGETAKDSCRHSAKEEKRLVVEKIEELR